MERSELSLREGEVPGVDKIPYGFGVGLMNTAVILKLMVGCWRGCIATVGLCWYSAVDAIRACTSWHIIGFGFGRGEERRREPERTSIGIEVEIGVS